MSFSFPIGYEFQGGELLTLSLQRNTSHINTFLIFETRYKRSLDDISMELLYDS